MAQSMHYLLLYREKFICMFKNFTDCCFAADALGTFLTFPVSEKNMFNKTGGTEMKTHRKDLVASAFGPLSYCLAAHWKCLPTERFVKTIEIVKEKIVSPIKFND